MSPDGTGPDVGIYIHIPFCAVKCPYCDFNSYAGESRMIPDYVDAVCRELRLYAAEVKDFRPASVCFGGGTPSTLSPQQVATVLGEVRRIFPAGAEGPGVERLRGVGRNGPGPDGEGWNGERPDRGDPQMEVSLEANPEGLTFERLEGYRRAGVNRLSLGAQSFSDRVLSLLGRRHNAARVRQAFPAARRAGFDNVSLDLIYGIPGQTAEEWRKTLEAAVDLGPEHVSCYALTLEEGRRLPSGTDSISDEVEDAAADMLALACRELPRSGYRHYEISNFSSPGRECRHNLLYWRDRSWLGVGAGAHSHIRGERWENLARPPEYVDRISRGERPVAALRRLSAEERRGDRAFLGLRLLEGVDLCRFEAEEGAALTDLYREEVAQLMEDGLVTLKDGRLRLTPKGIPLANQVFCRFV